MMPTVIVGCMDVRLCRTGGADGQTRRDCDTAVSQSLPSPVSVLVVSALSRVEINGQRAPALDRSTVRGAMVTILVTVVSVGEGGIWYSVIKFGRVNYLGGAGCLPGAGLSFPAFPSGAGLSFPAFPSGAGLSFTGFPSETGNARVTSMREFFTSIVASK